MLPIIGRQVESRQRLLVAGHRGQYIFSKGIEEINKQRIITGDKIELLANYLRILRHNTKKLTELSGVSSSGAGKYQKFLLILDFICLFVNVCGFNK